MRHPLRLASLVVATVAALPAGEALACGCFAPPDVSSPVIQAGERIAFTAKNGQVSAFIQIQWSGKASEFGWLLPLPSVPTLEVGTDDMFAVLQQATDPVFTLNTLSNCASASSGGCGGLASSAPSRGGAFEDAPDLGVAVRVDSVGPYDYAVLKADNKQAMLDWLNQNRYYVPAGTDAAVTPYIHPGGYFLALKLKSGKATGDVQPVVVHYASDLPMIPIVLTSVGAVPHMGILVWVLGSERAIPRNYFHSVLNLAALDWRNASNYNDLLVRAVAEAPRHHTFVTEYAGTSSVLNGRLSVPTATEQAMAAITDPLTFARYLLNEGFTYPFNSATRAVLAAHIAEPKELIDRGLSTEDYYGELDKYLAQWRAQFPGAMPLAFDPVATAKEMQERVIDPLVVANDTFRRSSYVTRLHTALSPEEMTDDPVFSFNGSLPEVSNQHFASLETDCNGGASLNTGSEAPTVSWPGSTRPASADSWPASLRIETITEQGAPTVVTDNTSRIPGVEAPGNNDGLQTVCSVGAAPGQRGMLLIFGLLALAALRQRRKLVRR